MYTNINGKNINISDKEIDKLVTVLKISHDEAVQTWLEDEGYLENPVVEELTQKAKVNKISREAKSEKPRKPTKRVRKPDEEKEKLIEILSNSLKNAGFEPQITNKSKIIELNIGENHYKIDLIKQRTSKKATKQASF